MSTELSWLDKLHQSQNTTATCAADIQEVAELLYAVGSDKMADRLMAASHRLMRAKQQSKEAVNEKISLDMDAVAAHEANFVNTLITLCK